ncbi:nickel pincer cofactor biosynthesis protein LarC, partial [Candidatus Desantisbacteria bacterium]|nr:nickel pincer cofactor biosynthesis protein LarC [Candidatus Desantisbacteria bacterium]
GISGDMILGALLDVGVDIQWLTQGLSSMEIEFSLEPTRVIKSGLKGSGVHILVDMKRLSPPEMFEIINKSSLDEGIKATSCRIIERIVQAEAFVHGICSHEVHLHELGDTDTIIDVVGSVLLLHHLGIEKVYSSPLNLGGGKVCCEHGILPVPAPATAELIKGFPVYSSPGADKELTTPTGAAIITTLGTAVDCMPKMLMERIGYGAGSYETNIPNILRVFIGESISVYEEDVVTLLSTNIDDMNPEIYDYLIEGIIKQGALDAYLIPIHGKKNRMGILLSVLTIEETVDRLISFIFSQTTTLGIRIQHMSRKKLPRRAVEIDTKYGRLKAKETIIEDKKRVIPEYEECLRIAKDKNVPLQEVYWECIRATSQVV